MPYLGQNIVSPSHFGAYRFNCYPIHTTVLVPIMTTMAYGTISVQTT